MSKGITKRLDYIDATKGVAILCITFLHFEQGVIPHWLNEWIGMFMITAFYVTSGWITGVNGKPIKPNDLLKKRIRQLGVPYLWFSTIIIVFDVLWIFLGLMDSGTLFRDIYKTIVLRGTGTLWFLPVLIIGEYIFVFVRNRRNRWLWGTFFLGVTLLIDSAYNSYWLPMRDCSELNKIIDAPMQPIVRGLYAWPIIAIGYIIAKRWGHNIITANRLKLLIISAVLFVISFILVIEPLIEIYYINTLMNNVLPTIAFMCLFAVFTKNLITRFFCYWGVNSLILMCTHYSITMEIIKTFDIYILHHSTFEGPRTILYFVITILLTYPLVYLFNGKLKFMLGKK